MSTTTTTETVEQAPIENLYETILNKIETLSVIKFAAYRVACKLRILQKHLKLTFVDYNALVRVFNTNQLAFGVETEIISLDDARKVVRAIYELISPYHFKDSSIDETVETLLRFLSEIIYGKSADEFDLHSFKILLFTLSNAKLQEKYRCFFRQITSPNVIATQAKLTDLFEILLKLPNHFDQVESFQAENIPACVQSCLDHTHDGIIREDIFVNWMSREPQTLVWLPTLHRLIATETVRHEAQCNTCHVYPIIGMRYRCLRCFNYDLCQTCFFKGDHKEKHDGTHPIEEYCKQVTPFEDFKAFMEFFKLKMGKNELRRKERYLTIERSKSFTDSSMVPPHAATTKNGHHSLNRTEKKSKEAPAESTEQSKTKVNSAPESETTNESKVAIPIHLHSSKEEPKKKKKSTTESSEVVKTKKANYVNMEEKVQVTVEQESSAPLLMPKQHKPMKKSDLMKKRTDDCEHYQLPPKEVKATTAEEDDDDYRPPLPPKQRHQNETSRALVYDFIGSELQELRATLAQFEKISSNT